MARVGVVSAWAFALLMQIPEAAQWRAIDTRQPTTAWVQPAAYWLNVLQPLAYWTAITAGAQPWRHGPWAAAPWVVGGTLAVGLTGVAIYKARCAAAVPTIKPQQGCAHLDLHWWSRCLGGCELGNLSGQHTHVQPGTRGSSTLGAKLCVYG